MSPDQAEDWIVYSASAGCQLARVRCGGYRRQCAYLIASPGDYAFVFYRERRLHIHRRRQQLPAPGNTSGLCPSPGLPCIM